MALLFLLPLVLLWVLFIRPQQRRLRQAQAIVASLEDGDEVITTGGIYGTVTESDDANLWLEIAPDVTVRVLRSAVAQRVPTDLDDLVDGSDDDGSDDDDDRADDDDDGGDGHDKGADIGHSATATSGSNGLTAGVPNGTSPSAPMIEPTTGDDEA